MILSKNSLDVMNETRKILVLSLLSPIITLSEQLEKQRVDLGESKFKRFVNNPHFLLRLLVMLRGYKSMCEDLEVNYSRFLAGVNVALEPHGITTDMLEKKFGREL